MFRLIVDPGRLGSEPGRHLCLPHPALTMLVQQEARAAFGKGKAPVSLPDQPGRRFAHARRVIGADARPDGIVELPEGYKGDVALRKEF